MGAVRANVELGPGGAQAETCRDGIQAETQWRIVSNQPSLMQHYQQLADGTGLGGRDFANRSRRGVAPNPQDSEQALRILSNACLSVFLL